MKPILYSFMFSCVAYVVIAYSINEFDPSKWDMRLVGLLFIPSILASIWTMVRDIILDEYTPSNKPTPSSREYPPFPLDDLLIVNGVQKPSARITKDLPRLPGAN